MTATVIILFSFDPNKIGLVKAVNRFQRSNLLLWKASKHVHVVGSMIIQSFMFFHRQGPMHLHNNWILKLNKNLSPAYMQMYLKYNLTETKRELHKKESCIPWDLSRYTLINKRTSKLNLIKNCLLSWGLSLNLHIFNWTIWTKLQHKGNTVVLSVGGKSRRLDLFLCCVASLLHMQRLIDPLTTVFEKTRDY